MMGAVGEPRQRDPESCEQLAQPRLDTLQGRIGEISPGDPRLIRDDKQGIAGPMELPETLLGPRVQSNPLGIDVVGHVLDDRAVLIQKDRSSVRHGESGALHRDWWLGPSRAPMATHPAWRTGLARHRSGFDPARDSLSSTDRAACCQMKWRVVAGSTRTVTAAGPRPRSRPPRRRRLPRARPARER